MSCYGSKELARSFRTVRSNTITIANEIPEDKYSFSPAPGCRTVGQTLVHIAVMCRVQEQIQFTERRSAMVGFDFFTMMGKLQAEVDTPRTKQQIIELLKSEGDKFAALLDGATDEFLAETVAFPPGMEPPVKTRFEMVSAVKEHEMHHRGQLMLVERMLGLTPHLTRHMMERIAAMKAAQAVNA